MQRSIGRQQTNGHTNGTTNGSNGHLDVETHLELDALVVGAGPSA